MLFHKMILKMSSAGLTLGSVSTWTDWISRVYQLDIHIVVIHFAYIQVSTSWSSRQVRSATVSRFQSVLRLTGGRSTVPYILYEPSIFGFVGVLNSRQNILRRLCNTAFITYPSSLQISQVHTNPLFVLVSPAEIKRLDERRISDCLMAEGRSELLYHSGFLHHQFLGLWRCWIVVKAY